jgi:hypothetical protein
MAVSAELQAVTTLINPAVAAPRATSTGSG